MKFSVVRSHYVHDFDQLIFLSNNVYIHVFVIFDYIARPSANCAGSSPLHPLFVCNGERDCANGIDEINCTEGCCLNIMSVYVLV